MKSKCRPITGTLNREVRDFLLADLMNVFHIEKCSFYKQYNIAKNLKFKDATQSNMLKDAVFYSSLFQLSPPLPKTPWYS